MSWRSIVISNPADLDVQHRSLRIRQADKEAFVPLEDISVLLIEEPLVNVTAYALAACAEAQVVVLTVDQTHHPNGVLLPFLPHSRMLKVMRAQLALKLPTVKRLWQTIIQQKLHNQGTVLRRAGKTEESAQLEQMARDVRSGDADRLEGTGARLYFRTLFGEGFRRTDRRIENAAMNYGYAIIRAAIARTLVSRGFLPSFGLFHQSEQNAFNLADDLIEPYRPIVDDHVVRLIVGHADQDLTPAFKTGLIQVMGRDIQVRQLRETHRSTLLAAVEATVMSLSRIVVGGDDPGTLILPESLVETA